MPAANDAFASPTVLTGTSGTAGIDNTGASYETGEPANDLGADGAASVWYSWTLGASTYGQGWDLTLDTDSSPAGWDSTLEVFTGSTLTGLTLVASADDINYPTNPRTLLTCTVPDSTTVRIRVDGWTPIAETTAGILTYSAVSAPPPAPTASGWDDLTALRGSHTMYAGDDIEVTGTGLDTVTSTSIGGVSQPFDITDSTHLTIHVTTAAVNGAVVVTNAGGSATAPRSGFTSAIVLYPGPWIQPSDLDAEEITAPGGSNTYGPASQVNSSTEPDFAGSPHKSFSDSLIVDVAAFAPQPTPEWKWDAELPVIGLGGNPPSITMPPYLPTAELAADPDAVDYDIEVVDPVPTSDLTLTFKTDVQVTHYLESTNGRTLAEDLWQETVQFRRIPDTDYSFTGRFELNSGVWPSQADLLAMTLDHEGSFVDTGETLVLSSVNGFTDNDAVLDDSVPAAFVDPQTVTWADFGTYRAWAVAFSSIVGDTTIAVPYIDPSETVGVGNGTQDKGLFIEPLVRSAWTYRPPRYRLIYTTPHVVATGWQVGSVAMT